MTDGLGTINYGAYAVVTATVYFLPWVDFGVSLGMVTTVSQADGRDDRQAIRAVVSTGMVMLLGVGAALLAVALALWALVDWRTVLGLTDPRITADVSTGVLLVLLSLVVGIPANLGMKVMLGLQMNRAFAFWQAAPVPLVVAAVVAGHATGAGLGWFVLATIGIPNATALLAALWLFRRARPDVAPRITLAERERLRPMLALGSAFAVNSGAWALSLSTASIVISHVVGAEAAGVYSISQKLSGVSFLVFESLLLPLWPMFGARLAAGDLAGTRAGLRMAVLASAVTGIVASAAFVWAAPAVIRAWLGPAYVPPTALLMALAVFSVLEFVTQPFTLVLNGAGAQKVLLGTASAMAVTTLPLSVVLTHAVGVAGTTWALAISMAGCVLIPSVVAALRLTRAPHES